MVKHVTLALLIFMLNVVLSSCGGGGGSSDISQPPPVTPPSSIAGKGNISGTVTTANGIRQGSVHVRVISRSDPTIQVGHFTDANGNYQIKGVPSGDYQVVVENIDGRSGLNRSRISSSLLEATPQFPDEFYSGNSETNTDAPSLSQVISVANNQTTNAVDFILNDSGVPSNDTVVGVSSPVLINVGSSVNGFLGEASDQVDDYGLGYFIDAFVLSGVAGQTINASLSSIDFDVFLIVLLPDGSFLLDDDSGGGTDAFLISTLPQTGPYIILVTSYDTGEIGNYNLSISAQPTSFPPLSVGAPIFGDLQLGDEIIDGYFIDSYQFNASAGTPVTVNLVSLDFDAYLFLITPSGVIEFNDDANNSTTDSLLSGVLLESGIHVVVVSTFSTGEVGAYGLQLDSP